MTTVTARARDKFAMVDAEHPPSGRPPTLWPRQDDARSAKAFAQKAKVLLGFTGPVPNEPSGSTGSMRTEPPPGLGSEQAHVSAFLGFLRATVVEKAGSLPDAALRRSSPHWGWSPLELVQHLAYMERRWFTWGFLGEPVRDPWGDSQGAPDGAWLVPADRMLADVVRMLEDQAATTERILGARGMDEVAALGGRFDTDPPELRWICFHVLQEYARHAGHLDIAVELAGGLTGE
jgi:hypothetical protein